MNTKSNKKGPLTKCALKRVLLKYSVGKEEREIKLPLINAFKIQKYQLSKPTIFRSSEIETNLDDESNL